MAAPRELARIAFVELAPQINCGGFKCSTREFTEWFKRKAQKEHLAGRSRVTCAVNPEAPHRPLGFYALATVAEEVGALKGLYQPFRRSDYFSALHLTVLATDAAFVDQGIGTRMVGHAIRTFAEVAPRIGLPHLILTPDDRDRERLISFYSKFGFRTYRKGEAMFLSQQLAVEAIREESAALQAQRIPQAEENEATTINTDVVTEQDTSQED